MATMENTMCCKKMVFATWNLYASASETLQESNQYRAQQEYVTINISNSFLTCCPLYRLLQSRGTQWSGKSTLKWPCFYAQSVSAWNQSAGKRGRRLSERSYIYLENKFKVRYNESEGCIAHVGMIFGSVGWKECQDVRIHDLCECQTQRHGSQQLPVFLLNPLRLWIATCLTQPPLTSFGSSIFSSCPYTT